MNNALLVSLTILLTMIGLACASVPIYNLFCKATGYAGTVQKGMISSGLGTRDIIVRFNTDVSPNLPWKFRAKQKQMKVHIGKNSLAFFEAENKSSEAIDGIAIYNVAPYEAAKYFYKVACFCFTQQRLNPHQKATLPVSFFIDPKIEKDPDISSISTITLSYTFFKVDK